MINAPPSDTELMRLLDRAHRQARMAGWTISRMKNAFRWSADMHKLLGHDSSQHPSIPEFLAMLDKLSARQFEEAVDRCLKDGRDFRLVVRTVRGALSLNVWGGLEKDEEGDPVVYGLCQDISGQVRQEQELYDTRARLQSILDEVPAVIYSKTKEGYFQYANPRFYEVVPTGGRASVLGLHSSDVFPEEVSREQMANDLDVMRTGKTLHSVEHVPQADGSIKYFDSFKFPTRDARGEITGITGVSIDITEKKAMQDDIDRQRALALHQSRLASIGELAAGVGHEINNPLTIVMSYLAQIESSLSESKDPGTGRNLEMILKARKASERIKSIVGGLRTFARTSPDVRHPFPVLRAVTSCVNMVKEIYAKDGVNVHLHPSADQPASLGDEGQIQQVVMNLLSNARDAVLQRPEKEITVHVECPGDRVHIRVCDTGPGIDPTHLARIFDPFFTTKEMSKGTGLGLSIAHSIVKDHGGEIRYRQLPNGSEFTVELPLLPEGMDSAEAATSELSPTPKSAKKKLGRILVADDEVDIQDILCMVLEQIGFDVESVGTGQEALEKIAQGQYDALITDINMPKLKGDELILRIRNELKNQGLKIFVISGGITQGPNDTKLRSLISGKFDKPFDQHILKSSLFTALGL